jgi:hypothetical protein
MTRIIDKGILQGLRDKYKETWGRDWPEDDTYLSELWHQAQSAYNRPQRGRNVDKVKEQVGWLMRECHEFDPGPPPNPTQSIPDLRKIHPTQASP